MSEGDPLLRTTSTGRWDVFATRRADLLAVGLLAALTAVFFGRLLFGGQALFFGDTIMGMYPALDLWRQYVAAGHLPLWNPYIFTGIPFLADAEFSTYYPTMVLNLLFPPHRAMAVDMALHVFMLAAGTYLFVRRHALSVVSSLLGAATFAFSGFVAVRVTQPNLIRTMAWLPLLLLAMGGLADPRTRRRALLLSGLVLAMQVLAGHLQTVLITGLLGVAYALWRTVRFEDPARRLSTRVLSLGLMVLLAGVLALTLAAAQILPGVELVRQSDRSGGTSPGFATSFSLPLRQLPMLLAPGLFGNPVQELYWGDWLYWEMVGYAGVASFLLALLGLLGGRAPDRLLWGGVAFVGVVLALGEATPAYRVASSLLPPLRYFRVPARFFLWYGWAVAVLAAYGLEALRSSRLSFRGWRVTAGLWLLVGTVGLYWAMGAPGVRTALQSLAEGAMRTARFFSTAFYPQVPALSWEIGHREGQRLALLWIGAGAVILALKTRRLSASLGAALLIMMVVVDLFSFGMNFYPTLAANEIYRPVPLERRIQLQGGAYRILTTPAFAFGTWVRAMTRTSIQTAEDLFQYRSALVPNIGAHRGISNVYGYSPIELARSTQFIGLAVQQAAGRDGRSALLDFMATRYILTRANLAATYERIQQDGYFVWLNPRGLPRGFLVTDFVVQPSDGRVQKVLEGKWDPARVVILDRAPRQTYGLRPSDDPGKIVGRSYELSSVSFGLDLSDPAILVLSDAYYPGWKAIVDGVEVPIYRANHAFRAVFLPAGARRVEFVFRPLSVSVGLVVSMTGWGAVATVLLLALRRRARLALPLPGSRSVPERVGVRAE